MIGRNFVLIAIAATLLGGCSTIVNGIEKRFTPRMETGFPIQRGDGLPFEVIGSQVWNVKDKVSGRKYQIYVSTPSSYARSPDRKYPVLYVTDASYAFPIINQLRRRVDGIDDFILIGLSYHMGEDGGLSRRRDYTPTKTGAIDAPPKAIYGGALDYLRYIKEDVIPFVDTKYRTDTEKRLYAGHSYGGLFGAQILLHEPQLFSDYILGSPSLWYDDNYTWKSEAEYAATHTDLKANVYTFIGEYEQRGLGNPASPNRYNMVDDAKEFERLLKSHNYPSLTIKTEVLNDEDHETIAPRGFTHGLKLLLPEKQQTKATN